MPPLGNDMKKILALGDRVVLARVAIADVFHDDWCAKLNGGPHCNCDPEIRFTPVERFGTDAHGDRA